MTTDLIVATVLTVYGIETVLIEKELEILEKLQQYLPFTVLKPKKDLAATEILNSLQQYLPFTVLKRTKFLIHFSNITCFRCNSTYRLRYLIEYMTKPRED